MSFQKFLAFQSSFLHANPSDSPNQSTRPRWLWVAVGTEVWGLKSRVFAVLGVPKKSTAVDKRMTVGSTALLV